MPPQKKALSPAKRAKADIRNARLREKRAADVAASGGAKSGKKKRKMADLAEEEMPVSGGGSSLSASNTQNLRNSTAALLEAQKNVTRLEAQKLALAEEAATFYKRSLGLNDTYMEYLEWADAEKKKRTEVLETKYQDVLDLNIKEYEEAQQEVCENWNQYHTCWFHYLDLLHLCNGKFMDTQEPINHTKLLRKSGFKFKHRV
jgi:hypothetical protein